MNAVAGPYFCIHPKKSQPYLLTPPSMDDILLYRYCSRRAGYLMPASGILPRMAMQLKKAARDEPRLHMVSGCSPAKTSSDRRFGPAGFAAVTSSGGTTLIRRQVNQRANVGDLFGCTARTHASSTPSPSLQLAFF